MSRFLRHVVGTEKQPLPARETARSALEALHGGVWKRAITGPDMRLILRPPTQPDVFVLQTAVRYGPPVLPAARAGRFRRGPSMTRSVRPT